MTPPEINFFEWLQFTFFLLIVAYLFFRLVSLAVFKSWSQVCTYKCYNCPLFKKEREESNHEEQEEKQEQEKRQG